MNTDGKQYSACVVDLLQQELCYIRLNPSVGNVERNGPTERTTGFELPSPRRLPVPAWPPRHHVRTVLRFRVDVDGRVSRQHQVLV